MTNSELHFGIPLDHPRTALASAIITHIPELREAAATTLCEVWDYHFGPVATPPTDANLIRFRDWLCEEALGV
jgi:hypothetical protein